MLLHYSQTVTDVLTKLAHNPNNWFRIEYVDNSAHGPEVSQGSQTEPTTNKSSPFTRSECLVNRNTISYQSVILFPNMVIECLHFPHEDQTSSWVPRGCLAVAFFSFINLLLKFRDGDNAYPLFRHLGNQSIKLVAWNKITNNQYDSELKWVMEKWFLFVNDIYLVVSTKSSVKTPRLPWVIVVTNIDKAGNNQKKNTKHEVCRRINIAVMGHKC